METADVNYSTFKYLLYMLRRFNFAENWSAWWTIRYCCHFVPHSLICLPLSRSHDCLSHPAIVASNCLLLCTAVANEQRHNMYYIY